MGLSEKNIAPLVLGGIIAAGASLAGNAIGASSQNKTNQTSIDINRENNAFNAQQAQIQRDWQEKMWGMNNSYNSPNAMISRGLNPFPIFPNLSFLNFPAGSLRFRRLTTRMGLGDRHENAMFSQKGPPYGGPFACRKGFFDTLNKFSMTQDTPLGFPAHTLPYRRRNFITLPTVSG